MGIPETLKSDNGPPFQGEDFAEFCREFGIKHRKITPAWPQSNGQVENFNKNLKRLIQRSYISGVDWRAELNSFLRSYRNTPHSATKVAPAQLIFNNCNSSKLPITFILDSSRSDLVKEARNNDIESKQRIKSYLDIKRGAKEHDLKVNDKVLLDQTYGKRLVNKYVPRWSKEIWIVKSVKGSMITAESGDRSITRNAIHFKKAPSSMLSEESYDEVLPICHSRSDSAETKAVGRAEHTDLGGTSQSIVTSGSSGSHDGDEQTRELGLRRSGRERNMVERFVAGPASGLINKVPKSTT
jgi:hypothetical protein